MDIVLSTLALLALAGGAFSIYFLLVYSGTIRSNVWWIPGVCHMSLGMCKHITDTPYGTILGRPNALWGSLYYMLLLLAVILTDVLGLDRTFLFSLSTFSVLVSLYLIWGLYRLRTVCRVCMAVHVVNFLFLIILTVFGGT